MRRTDCSKQTTRRNPRRSGGASNRRRATRERASFIAGEIGFIADINLSMCDCDPGQEGQAMIEDHSVVDRSFTGGVDLTGPPDMSVQASLIHLMQA